jgi:uncharacterized damage-inducible protein DinB
MSLNVQTARSEVTGIADQLRRMYDGLAWHGPALKEILANVSEPQATARPIQNAHNIWELVLHTSSWLRIARERLSATKNRDPSEAENWPAPSGSWPDALAALDRDEHDLEQAILSFPGERLNDPAPGTEPQTYYILLHGAIQHIAYHAGQIAILKKA